MQENTMKADWVIDILKDIRQFSEKNGMMGLAEQLDDAIFIAASEIGATLDSSGTVGIGTGKARGFSRATSEGEVH
jgi:hypothetical protein